MSRPFSTTSGLNLPPPPPSVASKLITSFASASANPSPSNASFSSGAVLQQRPMTAQSSIKLPTAPKSVITGKPLLSINGTRVIFKQIQPTSDNASANNTINSSNNNSTTSLQLPVKEVLCEGIIVDHNEGSKTVVIESGTQTLSGISTEHGGDVVTVWTGPAEIADTDDLAAIRQPDTLSVLYCLQQRFFTKLPYTWLTRDSLVYVNPFQPCPDVFAGGQPHPFSVAEQARKIIIGNESGTVAAVITGQSGSGKTEAAKMILKQFASSLSSSSSSSTITTSPGVPNFVSLISAVNPILESFGNAVTAANSNSSRFIRATRITTDRTCRPRGAEIQASLLETSRLCGLRPGESNFHIFYALVAGVSSREKVELELTDPSLFKSLVASSAFLLSPSLNQQQQQQNTWLAAAPPHSFRQILDAMNQIGMTTTDINLMTRALAFILHILNLEFAGDLQAKVSSATTKSLNTAARILKVDPSKLEESMTQARFVDPSTQQQISRKFTVTGATASRDTLARNLYQSLFMWIVGKINESLKRKCDEMSLLSSSPTSPSSPNSSATMQQNNAKSSTTSPLSTAAAAAAAAASSDAALSGSAKTHSLFILDIFGFESVRNVPNAEGVAPPSVCELNCHNGLEQLLINVVNEELQNLFTETSLVGFCDELSREGVAIPTNEMALAENLVRDLSSSQRRTLEALEKKAGGILSTIDDDSKLGTPSTAAVLQDRVLALATKQHAGVIKRPKGVPDPEHPSFIVEHFACPVPYSATGMSAKNKVSAAGLATVIPLVQADPAMLELLRAAEAASRRGSGSTTFTALLKEQFASVIETLKNAKCLWVRCIKPNSTNTPNTFDVKDVRRQLLTAGVLASASVLAQGLSVRLPIKDFALRFATCLDKYPFKDIESLSYKKIADSISRKIQQISQAQKFGVKSTGALALQRQREEAAVSSSSSSSSPTSAATSIQIGLTKVFCNADSYELLVATANDRLVQYVRLIQRIGRGMVGSFGSSSSSPSSDLLRRLPGRIYVGDILRQAIRRRIAHELALRMEREKPVREQLEVRRCAEEERSARQMQRLTPAAKQFQHEASALGQNVKSFLTTMHSELHRVCVDVGLFERLRKQKEKELEEQAKYAEEIERKRCTKDERESRAAALAAFRKIPTHQRLTAKKEEDEKRRREEELAKMKYQMDRAHRDVSRARAVAEQQLSQQHAKQHASHQVSWLHDHLRRSWQRLDQQAEIAGGRAAMQQAAPGYLSDYRERQRERSLGSRRTESILISPEYYSGNSPKTASSIRGYYDDDDVDQNK